MVREKVVAFEESGTVPISLAQDLIRSSTFWVDHRQGIIHPEPGWADRLDMGRHGWEVRFGANKFLVQRAILLSREAMLDELDRSMKLSEALDNTLLFRRLITSVRTSVANYSDTIFEYYTGGADRKEKSKGFYTDEAFAPGERLRFLDKKRFGLTPPSKDCWKGYMKFGVHAIKVETFAQRILELTR